MLILILFSLICSMVLASPYGPVFPITATQFDYKRYTTQEWDEALGNFTSIGGDTVFVTGEMLNYGTREDIMEHGGLQNCFDYNTSTDCVQYMENKMKEKGISVKYWLWYGYQEDYSSNLIVCPEFDMTFYSKNMKYFALVKTGNESIDKRCAFQEGSDVNIIFTTYNVTAGDPHMALLNSSIKKNVSVWLTLPIFPFSKLQSNMSSTTMLIHTYASVCYAILKDHLARLIGSYRISGYFFEGEIVLPLAGRDAEILRDDYTRIYIQTAVEAALTIREYRKKIALSTRVDTNRKSTNGTIEEHQLGFKKIFTSVHPDVIMVKDGRGVARAPYYWPNQVDLKISTVDPTLGKILDNTKWKVSSDPTYGQQYTASVQEIFKALSETYHSLYDPLHPFDFWLDIEAYEDDGEGRLCSLTDEGMDRVSIGHLEWALTVAGATTKKIAAWKWDPYYTCRSQDDNMTLYEEIKKNMARPIISECRFHSQFNRSVVVIGYNIDGPFSGFQVNWTSWKGENKTSDINGYYYETDYGYQHNLVASIVYIMLWDFLPLQELVREGFITVSQSGLYNPCTFYYNFG